MALRAKGSELRTIKRGIHATNMTPSHNNRRVPMNMTNAVYNP